LIASRSPPLIMHECARLRLDERIASAARGTRIALKPCSFIQDADASREAACDPPMKHTCDSMPNHETPLMTKPVGSPASPQAFVKILDPYA